MKAFIPAIVAGMLVSGCANSLLTKYQDNICVADCDTANPKYFEEPVFQTAQMFVAEMLCWFLFRLSQWYNKTYNRSQNYEQLDANPQLTSTKLTPKGLQLLLLGGPAFCDIVGTTLMNIGLLLTPVSIYQMTRGAVVLFTGTFSVLFLGRRISRSQWLGLAAVVTGVFIVGVAASRGASSDERRTPLQVTIGILLIIAGQIFTATQFVSEEFFLEKYYIPPLRLVAWEGIFGTITTVSISTIFYFIFGGQVFNLAHATKELTSTNGLMVSSVFIMMSMAAFNFCGINVTRHVSATSRSTVDTCRTIGIWVVSLSLGWESFKFLQLVGFVTLVYGTLLFNGFIGATNETIEEPLPEEFEHT